MENLKPLLAEFEKLKNKYISLCERKDKLEQIVRLRSNIYSEVKIKNTSILDKFSLYLENKFIFKFDKKISKLEIKLKKIERNFRKKWVKKLDFYLKIDKINTMVFLNHFFITSTTFKTFSYFDSFA